ncbi:hypothetical protein EON67_05110, partial [archaeon]
MGTLIFEMLAGFAPYEGDDQMTTFRNILEGRLDIPDEIEDEESRDVIAKLLARSVVDRLGCKKDGVDEIFAHPWFAKVSMEQLLRKAVRAPWKPDLEAEDDSRYFEEYEDSEGGEEDDEFDVQEVGADGEDDDDNEAVIVVEDDDDTNGSNHCVTRTARTARTG